MSEEKKRPNAHYKLSNENINPNDIVYHYNRERRLEKAPQSVRDLYKEEPRRRFGLFRSLTGTKSRALTFLSIVVICVMMIILSIIGYFDQTHTLEGNELAIQATQYENTVVITIKKTVSRTILSFFNTAYVGAVTVAVLPAGNTETANVFYRRIFFTHEQEEQYHFAIPFDAVNLLIIMQTERNTLSVTIQPE